MYYTDVLLWLCVFFIHTYIISTCYWFSNRSVLLLIIHCQSHFRKTKKLSVDALRILQPLGISIKACFFLNDFDLFILCFENHTYAQNSLAQAWIPLKIHIDSWLADRNQEFHFNNHSGLQYYTQKVTTLLQNQHSRHSQTKLKQNQLELLYILVHKKQRTNIPTD